MILVYENDTLTCTMYPFFRARVQEMAKILKRAYPFCSNVLFVNGHKEYQEAMYNIGQEIYNTCEEEYLVEK